VCTLEFSPTSKLLASASTDGLVLLWDTETFAIQKRLLQNRPTAHSGLQCMTFSQTGKLLATGSRDGIVSLWQVDTGTLDKTLPGHSGGATALCFLGDDDYLATGDANGVIRLWDLRAGKTLEELTQATQHAVKALALSPDGKLLGAAIYRFPLNQWWNVNRKPEALSATPKAFALGGDPIGITSIAFVPNSTLFVANPGRVVVWNLKNRQVSADLGGHRAIVIDVAVSNDGRVIISGANRDVHVWTTQWGSPSNHDVHGRRGDKIARVSPSDRVLLGSHSTSVSSVAVSHNAALAASGDAAGTVKIWNLPSTKSMK
jgi:WD40 repeat protein